MTKQETSSCHRSSSSRCCRNKMMFPCSFPRQDVTTQCCLSEPVGRVFHSPCSVYWRWQLSDLLPQVHLNAPLIVPFVHTLASSISFAGVTQVLFTYTEFHCTQADKASLQPFQWKSWSHMNGKTPTRGKFPNPAVKFPAIGSSTTRKPPPCLKISFGLVSNNLPGEGADNCCRCEGVRLSVKGHLIHNLVKSGHSLLGRSFTLPSNLVRAAQPWHLGSITLIRNTGCRS